MSTLAARRIVRRHNQFLKSRLRGQGFLIFNLEGNGGYWYTDEARANLQPDEFIVHIRQKKLTEKEAEEILKN